MTLEWWNALLVDLVWDCGIVIMVAGSPVALLEFMWVVFAVYFVLTVCLFGGRAEDDH